MADSKEIAAKVSVDIGDNITKLIEKLASQIGTTTDKVFPWYVKQQVIEGWCWLGCSAFVSIIGLAMAVLGLWWWMKDERDSDPAFTICVVGAFVTAIGFGFLLGGMAGSLTQINNPEYYALKQMTGDMARLLAR